MHFLAYMTRVLIQEARCTHWRNWKFWLLNCAARKRREYLEILKAKNSQSAPPDTLKKIAEKEIFQHGQMSLF